MIILGALIGVMGATVNPFSIGVAADVAAVPLGDGIGLRLVLWVLLTVIAIVFVLRYAARCVGTRALRWSGSTSPRNRARCRPGRRSTP